MTSGHFFEEAGFRAYGTMKRMEAKQRVYIAIDLKSFYASVECVSLGLDPLNANLVVADESRTDKTICLAVSPSLKALGISGRPRLFEVKQKVRDINRKRLNSLRGGFKGKSIFGDELNRDPSLEVDFVAAPPRMAEYIAVSRHIYSIYLQFVSPDDIHVYSIDEVFIDATDYLNFYKMNARDLAEKINHAVLSETGITSTAGIGTNLFLAKVAMDIVAKHIPADSHGVRIAELDEPSYRRLLWTHEPLTDFWRIGKGIAARLNRQGMFTMGDIARAALQNEGLLYDMFGINAEYLIDHAFGVESTTIADIKNYVPENRSLANGQVLPEPYTNSRGRIIVREMAEQRAADLLKKKQLADSFVLYVGYDIVNVKDPFLRKSFSGEIRKDWYGREVPASAGGSVRLKQPTSSAREITEALLGVYDSVTDPGLFVRRFSLSAMGLIDESDYRASSFEQLDLFSDADAKEKERKEAEENREKERKVMEAMQEIRTRYGKNAVLKGTDFEEGAMTRTRNQQIGGHKA